MCECVYTLNSTLFLVFWFFLKWYFYKQCDFPSHLINMGWASFFSIHRYEIYHRGEYQRMNFMLKDSSLMMSTTEHGLIIVSSCLAVTQGWSRLGSANSSLQAKLSPTCFWEWSLIGTQICSFVHKLTAFVLSRRAELLQERPCALQSLLILWPSKKFPDLWCGPWGTCLLLS